MRTFHRFPLLPLLFIFAIGGTGCSSLAPPSLQKASSKFLPEQFFEGPVRSWGVIESRSGSPSSSFRTELNGVRDGADLLLTQKFFFERGQTQDRVWRIRRLDEHHYEATANDVVGTGKGEAHGSAFQLEYTLAVRPGNRLFNVRMKHWMYLQPDGTMINRVQVKKFGVTVRQVTEHFRRGVEPVAAIGRN